MATWKKVIVSGSNISQLNNDANYLASTGGGILSGSTFASSNQGEFTSTINGVANTVDLGLQTSDSPTFVSVTADLTGTASIATKLTDARDFSISGDATANAVSFDGSGNVALSISLDDNVVDSAELVDGAVDESHFSADAESAISGAFAADSASIATRLDSLEGSDFNYNLSIGADSGADDVVADGSTIDFAGGTNLNSAVSDDRIVYNLDSDISLTSVTASIQGNVDGDLNGNVTGDLTGNVTGNVTGDLSGNADTATALANSRDFSISGDATAAAVSFDGSGNVALSLSLDDDVVGADEIADGAIANVAIASNAAIAESKLDFGGTGYVSGSTFSSPSQGTVRATINGVNSDIDTGLQTGDSPTFASLTLTGDLTVQGTRTELNVTNLNVEDQFILINSGASAADGGLVVNGAGSALGWDNSEGRFALDYAGATFDQTSITSDAYISAVVTSDDANYQKVGNIRIDTANEDIYIYS